MANRALLLYISSVCLLAAGSGLILDWGVFSQLTPEDWWGLGTLMGLAILAEAQAVDIHVGRSPGGNSMAFLPLFSTVLLFGPAPTVLVIFFNGVVAEHFIRKKELQRAVFNVGQYVLCSAIAGLTYTAAGGEALMLIEGEVTSSMLIAQLGPFVLFGVVFLFINNSAVAGAITLSQGLDLREVWLRLVGGTGSNLLSDLLIGPIAIAVAALYMQIHITGLLLLILPLYFIRRSYFTAVQLQHANRDLLKALVKAIETRDPYTSGHSVRVAHLARRIAETMGLDGRTVEEVETAALLHDVGKIEAVYTDIIAKPDALTPEERIVIESHVTKGEELLRNLASVPESVIKAVRHHHEREDGSGYPDALTTEQIPLGSQIISVCDAVDAMLSDRPYRTALSVPQVLQQLQQHAGSQFNRRVVDALIHSGLLGEYADLMRVSSRASSPGAARLMDPDARVARRRGFPWRRRVPWG